MPVNNSVGVATCIPIVRRPREKRLQLYAGSWRLASPHLKCDAQSLDESPKRSVGSCCTVDVYVLYDVFSVFNTSKSGYRPRVTNGFDQALFISSSITFLIGCITPHSKYCLEGRTVQQKPTLDVRIGNGMDHRCKFFSASDLPHSLSKSSAIGVCRDDDQIGSRISLPFKVTHIVLDFCYDFPVATYRTPPIQMYIDSIFAGDPPDEGADDELMCIVLGKKARFHASKSPLKMRAETGSPSSSSESACPISRRRASGPHVENGSIRV